MCEHFKNRIESESIEGFESEFENQILNKQIFGFGLGFRYDLEDLIRYRRSHKQIFGFVFGSDRVDKDSIRFNISKLYIQIWVGIQVRWLRFDSIIGS